MADWLNQNLGATTEDVHAVVFNDKAGNVISTVDKDNRKQTFPASSTLDVSAATVRLPTNLRTGTIDLPLQSWRVTNNANTDYGLVAATALIGSGGVGGIDAEPALTRVNAATDTTARLVWLDAKLDPILNDFTIPYDADVTATFTLNILAAMSGTNNATSILTATWVVVGTGAYAAGSDQGGATSAFAASASLVTKTITIAANAINAPGNHVSVSLTPTSPGTDAMHMYGAYVTYTKRL